MGKAEKSMFEGFQSVDRKLEGMPFRIVYIAPHSTVAIKEMPDDWIFEATPSVQRPTVKDRFDLAKAKLLNEAFPQIAKNAFPRYLDPYAIRYAFDEINDPRELKEFLSVAGPSWPFRRSKWSQFQQWKEFFSWLRQEPEEALKEPEGAKAWETAKSGMNLFFSSVNLYSNDETGQEAKEFEAEIAQEMKLLCGFALCLGGLPGLTGMGRPNRLTLGWYDPKDDRDTADGGAPENWLGHWQKRGGLLKGWRPMTFLQVRVDNVLEAIAATIYADRAVGLKYRKCKHKACNRLFQIRSRRDRRKYCPDPRNPESSNCRENAKKARAREREKANEDRKTPKK